MRDIIDRDEEDQGGHHQQGAGRLLAFAPSTYCRSAGGSDDGMMTNTSTSSTSSTSTSTDTDTSRSRTRTSSTPPATGGSNDDGLIQLPNWLLSALASSSSTRPLLASGSGANQNGNTSASDDEAPASCSFPFDPSPIKDDDEDDDKYDCYFADMNNMPPPRPLVLVSPSSCRKQTSHPHHHDAATPTGEEHASSGRRGPPPRLYYGGDTTTTTTTARGRSKNDHTHTHTHTPHSHDDAEDLVLHQEERGGGAKATKQARIGTIPTDIDKIKVFVKAKPSPRPVDRKVQKMMDYRARKNVLARERSRKQRELLETIQDKDFEELTDMEQDIYKLDMERRHTKNVTSRERSLQKKKEVSRIMAKPEHDRTSLERTFVDTALTAQRIKIKGDRQRRKQEAGRRLREREEEEEKKNHFLSSFQQEPASSYPPRLNPAGAPHRPPLCLPPSRPTTTAPAGAAAAGGGGGAAVAFEDHKEGPLLFGAVPLPVPAPYNVPCPTTVMWMPPFSPVTIIAPDPTTVLTTVATSAAKKRLLAKKKNASSRVPGCSTYIYSGPPGGMMLKAGHEDLPRPSTSYRGRAVNENKNKAVKKKAAGVTKKMANGGGMFSSTTTADTKKADALPQWEEDESSPTLIAPPPNRAFAGPTRTAPPYFIAAGVVPRPPALLPPPHSCYSLYPAFYVVGYPPEMPPFAGLQYFYPVPNTHPPGVGPPPVFTTPAFVTTNETKTVPNKKSFLPNGSAITAGKRASSGGVATSSSHNHDDHDDGSAAVHQAQVIPPSPAVGYAPAIFPGADHENLVLHQHPDVESLLVGVQCSDADMWPSHDDAGAALASTFASAPTTMPNSPLSTKRGFHAPELASHKNELVAHGSAFDETITTTSATSPIVFSNDHAIQDHTFLFINADGRSMPVNVNAFPGDASCGTASHGEDSSIGDEWLGRF